MAWVTVPALDELFTQLNRIAPNRDKESDGRIGDAAHASGKSSHNPDDWYKNAEWEGDSDKTREVRAIDVDVDFKNPLFNAQELVNHLVKYAKNGTFWWIRYVIYNGYIWHKNSDWERRVYTGSNKHTKHVHINNDFSQRADTVKNVNYRLSELVEVPKVATQFNSEDIAAIKSAAKDGVDDLTQLNAFGTGGGSGSNVGNSVLGHGYPKAPGAQRTAMWQNLQDLQTDLTEVQLRVETLSADNTILKNEIGQLTADPYIDNFLTAYIDERLEAIKDEIIAAINA
jgi:hypothetical protein